MISGCDGFIVPTSMAVLESNMAKYRINYSLYAGCDNVGDQSERSGQKTRVWRSRVLTRSRFFQQGLI